MAVAKRGPYNPAVRTARGHGLCVRPPLRGAHTIQACLFLERVRAYLAFAGHGRKLYNTAGSGLELPMTRTNYYQRKVVGIYLIQHSETLRSYCGQSRDVLSRWKSHCSGGKAAVGIAAAIRDEGVDSFLFRVLEECEVSQLNEREVFWIEHYDCVEPHGYNRNSGGGAPTYVSKKTREKLSTSLKGKTLSPEHRAKTSAANKGKSLSPETRAKIGAAHKGMTRSPEACANIGAAKKGKTRSPEAIAAVVEGRRRNKAARAAAAETASYSEPLLEALQSLRADSTWIPMVEDVKPPAGPPSVAPPTLAELEEILSWL